MSKVKISIEKNSDSNHDDLKPLLNEFLFFANKGFKFKNPFHLHLVYSDVPQIETLASYDTELHDIWVKIRNRGMICDIFRSIAHELVHHKQNELGKLNNNSGEDGSVEENEANSVAGLIIRKFGKKYPQIYQ